MWTKGKINGFDYTIKHFAEGSVFGIDEGKISKLWIGKNGKTYANYDRGWDVLPTDPEAIKVYNELLKKYN